MKKEEIIEALKKTYGEDFDKVYKEAIEKYGKERKALNSMEFQVTTDSVSGYVLRWKPFRNGSGGSLVLRDEDGVTRYLNFSDPQVIEKFKEFVVDDFGYYKFSAVKHVRNMMKMTDSYSATMDTVPEKIDKPPFKLKVTMPSNVKKMMDDLDGFEDDVRRLSNRRFYFAGTITDVFSGYSESYGETSVKIQIEDDNGYKITGKIYSIKDEDVEPRNAHIYEIFPDFNPDDDTMDRYELALELKNMDVIIYGRYGQLDNGKDYLVVENIFDLDKINVEIEYVDMNDVAPASVKAEQLTSEKGMTKKELQEELKLNDKNMDSLIEHLLSAGVLYEEGTNKKGEVIYRSIQ